MGNCSQCGAACADVAEASVGGTTFRVGAAGLCPACGDAKRAVARHAAQHGPVSGETFRFMRMAVGLPAKRVAELLGRTPEAISRWEAGTQKIDPLAWALLGAIVVEDIDGKTHTIDRLDAMRVPSPAPEKPLDLEAVRRPARDARAQQDAKLYAIAEVVRPYSWRRRKPKAKGGFSRLFPRELLPGESSDRQFIVLRDGSPEEAEWRTQMSARSCFLDLCKVDTRFASLPGPRAEHFDVPVQVADALRKGERDNGHITNAAKLAWEARIIERREGETWQDAERRAVRRVQAALKGRPPVVGDWTVWFPTGGELDTADDVATE